MIAHASIVPAINYVGNFDFSDAGGISGFNETITLTNPFGYGAGAVTSYAPGNDTLFNDAGIEYIGGSGTGGSIVLTLDESNFTSGLSYSFNPTTYQSGFLLFDDDGALLFSADLTANNLKVDNSTGSINSMFDMNLTNIVAGAAYLSGASRIIDSFLSNPGGAANFTLNIAGDISAAIESAGGKGTYSGSASVVPVPAALPLFISALGMLGFYGFRTRRT